MSGKWRIRRGDQVVVLTGRERGKKGEVVRVFKDDDRVIVQGVNMVKRHQKPSPQNPGGIVDKEAWLHVSNVSLIDPKDGSATRIGFKVLEDGSKVRFAKRSGETIDR